MSADQFEEGSQLWYLYRLLRKAGCKQGEAEDWTCPSHEDESPSLGIGVGRKGNVVISCAAGCETDEVLEALGTSMAQVLAHEGHEPNLEIKGTNEAGSPKAKLTTREQMDLLAIEHGPFTHTKYSYRTPDERLVREVHRYDFEDGYKTIRQRIIDKNTAALYRQDLVTKALDEGLPIYVMEGEKAAGLFNDFANGKAVATSSPGGAGKWLQAHGALLDGAAKVVVVADRDKAGYKHAQMVVESLKGRDLGCDPLVVTSKTEGKGDDWAEHQAAGFRARDLTPYVIAADEPEEDEDESDEEKAARRKDLPYPTPNDPREVAKRLLKDEFTFREHRSLLRYRSEWWRWERGYWHKKEEEGLAGEIEAILSTKFWLTMVNGESEVREWVPNTKRTNEVLKMLRGLVHVNGNLPPGIKLSDPGEPGAPKVLDLLPLRSTLIDLTTGANYREQDTTPDFLMLHALPYVFDRDAECPRWLQFLEETWPDDPESRLLLQEWFGHVLTSENAEQVFLSIYGAPASGKTTIHNVLNKLLGVGSIAMELDQLATEFGKSQMATAKLAVAGDARWSGKDNARIVGAIIQITGETPIRIRDLYSKPHTAMPTARLMLIANERPNFHDSSGAMMRRQLLLETKLVVPIEQRDTRLMEKLEAEMAGIIQWAIDGLVRLRSARRFTRPESTRESIAEIGRAQSSIQEFVEDWCELGAFETPLTEFGDAYRSYREMHGSSFIVDNAQVSKDLQARYAAAVSSFRKRPRPGERQQTYLHGVRLLNASRYVSGV